MKVFGNEKPTFQGRVGFCINTYHFTIKKWLLQYFFQDNNKAGANNPGFVIILILKIPAQSNRNFRPYVYKRR